MGFGPRVGNHDTQIPEGVDSRRKLLVDQVLREWFVNMLQDPLISTTSI